MDVQRPNASRRHSLGGSRLRPARADNCEGELSSARPSMAEDAGRTPPLSIDNAGPSTSNSTNSATRLASVSVLGGPHSRSNPHARTSSQSDATHRLRVDEARAARAQISTVEQQMERIQNQMMQNTLLDATQEISERTREHARQPGGDSARRRRGVGAQLPAPLFHRSPFDRSNRNSTEGLERLQDRNERPQASLARDRQTLSGPEEPPRLVPARRRRNSISLRDTSGSTGLGGLPRRPLRLHNSEQDTDSEMESLSESASRRLFPHETWRPAAPHRSDDIPTVSVPFWSSPGGDEIGLPPRYTSESWTNVFRRQQEDRAGRRQRLANISGNDLTDTRAEPSYERYRNMFPGIENFVLGASQGRTAPAESTPGLDDNKERPPPLEPGQMKIDCECKICFGQIADTLLLPCAHLALCEWCADQIGAKSKQDFSIRTATCPCCRKVIEDRIKVFRA